MADEKTPNGSDDARDAVSDDAALGDAADSSLGSSAVPADADRDLASEVDEVAIDPPGEQLAVPGDAGTDYQVVDPDAEELMNADDTVDDTPDSGDPADVVVDDPDQLAKAEQAAVEADSTAVATRAPKRKHTQAPVKKESVVTKEQGHHPAKRTGPGSFVRQSVDELRKVVWPTGAQTRDYFIAVLLFVIFIMTFVGLLDLGFGWLHLKLFG